MISFETESKLAEVLFKISYSESLVEESRFVLSSHEAFDPFTTFKAADRLGIGCFSTTELLAILDKNHFYCTNEEAYLTIKQYDTNQQGRLGIEEFFQLVLPSTCSALRNIAQGRNGVYCAEVDHLFVKLLQSEITYHRVSETAKKSLVLQHDFSVLECFRSVDIRNKGFIDRSGLMDFLRRHKSVNEIDVDSIFRRLDNDGDDLMSYQEFVENLMPSQISGLSSNQLTTSRSSNRFDTQGSYYKTSSLRTTSPIKQTASSINLTKMGYKTSPIRTSTLQNSTFASSMRSSDKSPRRGSPLRSLRKGLKRSQNGVGEKSPIRNSTLNVPSRTFNQSSFSPQRKNSPLRRSSPVKKTESSLKSSRSNWTKPSIRPIEANLEETELVNWFQEEIKICRDVEKKKNELALRHDFNLIDAFRLFDKNDFGSISLPDFEDTFKYFNFSAPRDEIYLLLKHYSPNSRLSFSDFSELISPKQIEYARILRNRSPNNTEYFDNLTVFSPDTLNLILDTFRLLLDAESLAERVRQKLTRMPDFSLHQAFTAIDKDRNGFITIDEFQNILHNHGIFASSKDLQNLLSKYDKNRDGRVSYSEFVDEITPKSPRRF